MKIYLFSPETGVYQGEDYSDPAPMIRERPGLPPGATTIAPPPFERGMVPVFIAAEKRWELRKFGFPKCERSSAQEEPSP
jgi:hypothetical protein